MHVVVCSPLPGGDGWDGGACWSGPLFEFPVPCRCRSSVLWTKTGPRRSAPGSVILDKEITSSSGFDTAFAIDSKLRRTFCSLVKVIERVDLRVRQHKLRTWDRFCRFCKKASRFPLPWTVASFPVAISPPDSCMIPGTVMIVFEWNRSYESSNKKRNIEGSNISIRLDKRTSTPIRTIEFPSHFDLEEANSGYMAIQTNSQMGYLTWSTFLCILLVAEVL